MPGRTRSKRGNPFPLIVEAHPPTYTGYPFITLIEYRREHQLTIVDFADEKTIRAYVLDLCGPEQVSEEMLVAAAHSWQEHEHYGKIPFSIAFTHLGISKDASRVYRSLSKEFVTRVIGPLPTFDLERVRSVKRRRRKPVPPGVEIIRNATVKL